MNALKMAGAVARFRLLRSLGVFVPGSRPGTFIYDVDISRGEKLANGAPDPVVGLKIKDLINGFEDELTALCQVSLADPR